MMNAEVPECIFDPERFETTQLLFPSEIEDDDWVLFHGTSSSHEPEIEQFGLKPNQSVITSESIDTLFRVCTPVDWIFKDAGGFGALSYARNDLANDVSPFYLAASSRSALGYATRSAYGGEKYRAVRKILSELEWALFSSDGQSQFVEGFNLPYSHWVPVIGMRDARVLFPSFEEARTWLLHEWDKLEAIRNLIRPFEATDCDGFVYALRIPKEDISGLTLNAPGQDGIAGTRTLSPDCLIAKVRIPTFYEYIPGQDDKKLQAVFDPRGVIAAIKAATKARSSRYEKSPAAYTGHGASHK